VLRKVALVLGVVAVVLYLAGAAASQETGAKATAGNDQNYVITVMIEDTEFEDGVSVVTSPGQRGNITVDKEVLLWQKKLVGAETKEVPSYAEVGIDFDARIYNVPGDGKIRLNYSLSYSGIAEENEGEHEKEGRYEEREEFEREDEEEAVREDLLNVRLSGEAVVKEGVETVIGKIGDKEIKIKVSALK